jgi:outer membrane lipoprotein-sorting protein
MKRAWWWVLLPVSLSLLAAGFECACGQEAGQGAARFVTVPALLQKIEAKAKTLKSLKGQFQQTKSTRLLVSPLESQGSFYWQPPDRFRWEVTHPSLFTLVARSDTVMIYTPDLKRASLYRHPAGDGLLGQIIGTAGDTEAFKNTYYMQITPTSVPEERKWVQLQLQPRSPRQARYLTRVEVMIDPANWLPQKITISEANGDRSIIRLSHLVENAELAEDLFSVQPPAGVQTQQFQGNRRP